MKITISDNEQKDHAISLLFIIDPCDMKEIVLHAQTLQNKRVLSAEGVRRAEVMKLIDEYHGEIMAQTCQGVPGADFTRANELYLEMRRKLTGKGRKCQRCNGKGYFLIGSDECRCPDCNPPIYSQIK